MESASQASTRVPLMAGALRSSQRPGRYSFAQRRQVGALMAEQSGDADRCLGWPRKNLHSVPLARVQSEFLVSTPAAATAVKVR